MNSASYFDSLPQLSTLNKNVKEKESEMATFKQDIPNRVTIYHDDLEQEKAVKNALAPEKPRYFNGSPTYQAESVESFKQKLADVGMSLDR
ncbi:hypothetical protein VSVS12_03439 [Vibrio scophthalmi]|nr:hypothetical protein VSVS12_03439 [Vibrio scophthalmi]